MTQPVMTSNRDPGRWLVLAACIVAVLMAAIDVGILNLIVPAIQKEFDASQATIGLMTSISTLMLAAFILGGGTLGDLYGRRRFILIGTGGIVAAAVLSMLAPSANSLIAIRALDGIFQALVNPLALAILTVTFDSDERPKRVFEKCPAVKTATTSTKSACADSRKIEGLRNLRRQVLYL
jgi:MFS family permease